MNNENEVKVLKVVDGDKKVAEINTG